MLTANDSAVTVRFVDFGNTDVVDILSKPLRALPPKLAAAERYAKRCGLNVAPIDRDFGHEVTERIQELVTSDTNPLMATVVKEGEPDLYNVEVFLFDFNLPLMACSIIFFLLFFLILRKSSVSRHLIGRCQHKTPTSTQG